MSPIVKKSAVLSMVVFLLSCCFTAHAKKIMIDDFDMGEPRNMLGDEFNVWEKDPDDLSQWCRMTFDPREKMGDKGLSLKLDYSVESKHEAYNGLWMKLKDLDLQKMKYLVLHVKGDGKAGFTKCVGVELKNKNQTGKAYLTGITDRWRKIVLPLSKFEGVKDWSAMKELTIVFVDSLSSAKKGVIYMDDIFFSDEEMSEKGSNGDGRCLVIENFDDGAKLNRLGGRFDVWQRGVDSSRQFCRIDFDPRVKTGKSGNSLKIEYNIASETETFNGVWMKLNGLDAGAYRYLTFFVKGDKKTGFTRRVKLELEGDGRSGSVVYDGINGRWKRVIIPLKSFRGINDFKSLDEFVIIFDNDTVTSKAGVLYIDDLRLVKKIKYSGGKR